MLYHPTKEYVVYQWERRIFLASGKVVKKIPVWIKYGERGEVVYGEQGLFFSGGGNSSLFKGREAGSVFARGIKGKWVSANEGDH